MTMRVNIKQFVCGRLEGRVLQNVTVVHPDQIGWYLLTRLSIMCPIVNHTLVVWEWTQREQVAYPPVMRATINLPEWKTETPLSFCFALIKETLLMSKQGCDLCKIRGIRPLRYFNTLSHRESYLTFILLLLVACAFDSVHSLWPTTAPKSL